MPRWPAASARRPSPAYGYSGFGIALFALVGAAGAAIAPLAGRWADTGVARPMTAAALVLAAVAFALAGLGRHHVVLLGLAAVLLDTAVQTTLILGQHRVYQIDPGARARLNSAYIATFFLGGAAGSQVGSIAYHAGGWTAVSAFGTALPLVALVLWLIPERAPAR